MRAAAAIILVLAGCSEGGEPEGPPPRPDSITVRPLGVRGAEVGWHDRSEGSAWFSVERSDAGEPFREVGRRPPGSGVWEEWGLAPGSSHRYRVRALDGKGRSQPSDAIEVVMPPTLVPEPRVEVFDRMAVSPGVTLFNIEDYHDIFGLAAVMAVDEEGTVLFHLELPGQAVSETDVFPNGDILAQVGTAFSRIDRKGDLVDWNERYFLHHDVDVLPWGNLLAITSEPRLGKTGLLSDAYSTDIILEIDVASGDIVWGINLDTIISPGEICPLCIDTQVGGGKDWIHMNSLDYDLYEEAVYISVRNANRIYKLSYPEGEVEWVMGDGGDFGEGLFDHQHNPVRLAPGRILVFDNGFHTGPFSEDRSRIVEIEYDPAAGAARIVWIYDGPPPFFSEAQGDVSPLPNGNILVTDSGGPRILEITREGLPVWELTLPPPYLIYKAHRIENFP